MRANVVMGPESSGNRFMTRLLTEAGHFGDGAHAQPVDGPGFDLVFPDPLPRRLAVCRSVPHHDTWPNPARLHRQLRDAGYARVLFLWMTRRTDHVARSQVANGHAFDHLSAVASVRHASEWFYTACAAAGLDWIQVHYDALGDDDYLRWLGGMVDAELPNRFSRPGG